MLDLADICGPRYATIVLSAMTHSEAFNSTLQMFIYVHVLYTIAISDLVLLATRFNCAGDPVTRRKLSEVAEALTTLQCSIVTCIVEFQGP